MKRLLRVGALSIILLCICLLGLTACGDKVSQIKNAVDKADHNDDLVTSISVNKDGSIISNIIEEFGEAYYDVSGLKSMIEENILEYSNQSSASQVSLKSCEAVNNAVKVEMEFNDYKAYADFNGENFFAGTIQAAYEAGYDLDMTLNAVSSKTKDAATISKPGLLSMGENHIVILEKMKFDGEDQAEETVRINCFADILYIGEGVSTVGKKSADISLAEGLGIIVFK